MTNLFSWLLRRFLAAFALLFIVQLSVYFIGLQSILAGYEKNKVAQYERLADEILTGQILPADSEITPSGPFFVFTADRVLVYSNKGKGKSIDQADLRPVYSGSDVIGYFYAGDLNFTDSSSNRIFLVSVIILSGASVILSIIIGFIAAFLSAKRIARPVNEIRSDIHRIRTLAPVEHRDFSIGELAEISADIVEASETLRSQEDYKRQWLRDLSHDLRTPLAGLKAQLEAMADGVLEAGPERLKRNLSEIERLEALAESIGELTSIESLGHIERRKFRVKPFIDLLIAPFELEIERKNISLQLNIESEELYADERLMLRAVGNILSNAVKYIDEGGIISLEIADGRIVVSNNGPDIPPGQRELIFTRLYRGDAGRTSPGSGLGLSITREIIRLHDGECRVEPLHPRGVSFVVILGNT